MIRDDHQIKYSEVTYTTNAVARHKKTYKCVAGFEIPTRMISLPGMLVEHSPAGRTVVVDHTSHLLQKPEHLLAVPNMSCQSSIEKPLLAASQNRLKSTRCRGHTIMSKTLISSQSNNYTNSEFHASLGDSDAKYDEEYYSQFHDGNIAMLHTIDPALHLEEGQRLITLIMD